MKELEEFLVGIVDGFFERLEHGLGIIGHKYL